MTSVSVVIPCYNDTVALPEVLDELKRVICDLPHIRWEIIVIDDHSEKPVADFLAAQEGYEDVIVITHPVNRGYGASIKTGVYTPPSCQACSAHQRTAGVPSRARSLYYTASVVGKPYGLKLVIFGEAAPDAKTSKSNYAVHPTTRWGRSQVVGPTARSTNDWTPPLGIG